jgi:hypothetical protein
MKRVAIDLNRDGVVSPQPREGRPQSWAQSSVRHILLNERYRGVVLWGENEKDSLTGNGEARLSTKARKRMAPSRDPGATDRLRRIVEADA